ncbi:MAG: glycosyltransferase [Sterolibacteriaceae bacterium]|nr:glycosyltransferase [Sterolibacteriaceae bacterium]
MSSTTRSGIQRVVVETIRSMSSATNVDFVKWDRIDGQLRYLDQRDLDALFIDDRNSRPSPNQHCHRVNYRFGDVAGDSRKTWLLFPEIPYHMPNGNEIFARILAQCSEYRIPVAAIFYDLIPIRDEDYVEMKQVHLEYVLQLSRCDLIAAISETARLDLLNFYREHLADASICLDRLERVVKTAVLGTRPTESSGSENPPTKRDAEPNKRIVMLGTVEPRKQQTRFLRVFNDTMSRDSALKEFDIDIFGSLHPASSAELRREMGRNRRIRFHQYSSDEVIDESFKRATFSVFPSRFEGYGLPIVESLRRGVPCLTASFGAMSEVAKGGGCLTVDVRSDEAIASALIKLATQPDLVKVLRDQATRRTFRSWDDYVVDLLVTMREHLGILAPEWNAAKDRLGSAIGRAASSDDDSVEVDIFGVRWSVLVCRPSSAARSLPVLKESSRDATRLLVFLDYSAENWLNVEPSILERIAHADVICARTAEALDELVEEMKRRETPLPLPSFRFVGSNVFSGDGDVFPTVFRLSADSRRVSEIAIKEQAVSSICKSLSKDFSRNDTDLTVVISTYNRAPFVEANVRWLIKLTAGLRDRVRVVVVDNASTDDTLARLEALCGAADITLLSNPANVGMLGNLRECSSLMLSRHVWIIGDDDFIRPGAIERVLNALAEFPQLPILSHNFAVFFRQSIGAGDTVAQFHREATPVSLAAIESGLHSIATIAEQHDNLFTAIYPIVMRSDLLAACFNFPFDGPPFESLVESVPTSKLIFESLRCCYGYWISDIGISGNAHNSWSSHRPRWHLVLMPQVLALAREAGVDEMTIWKWMKTQLSLFVESVDLAIVSKSLAYLSKDDLIEARWRFRSNIRVPSMLRVSERPNPWLWQAADAEGQLNPVAQPN